MINSRATSDLLPIVEAKALDFIKACKERNIDVIITSTYRDNESQAALYAIGRTIQGDGCNPLKPMGRIVTKAPAGSSFHNYRVAFDFCPIVNGKAQWDNAALFVLCGEIAESVGLEWAGRWKTFPETAHCQFTGGLTLAQFKAGELPTYA